MHCMACGTKESKIKKYNIAAKIFASGTIDMLAYHNYIKTPQNNIAANSSGSINRINN